MESWCANLQVHMAGPVTATWTCTHVPQGGRCTHLGERNVFILAFSFLHDESALSHSPRGRVRPRGVWTYSVQTSDR